MKTLVVYRSVTGFTRQIAQWIASDLHADVAAADAVGPARLQDYDCVVFGGRLHAVGIAGLSLIKRNWAQLKNKRVISLDLPGMVASTMPDSRWGIRS